MIQQRYSGICKSRIFQAIALTIGGSCFYLDTPDNARRNGMPVKPKYEQEISTT